MAIRSRENLFGAWAFLAGIVIAVLIGVFAQENINPLILGILALLGLVVGYWDISLLRKMFRLSFWLLFL